MHDISVRLREAMASRSIDDVSRVLESRARVLAEFAASASREDLEEAQADTTAVAEFLTNEKTSLLADVRRSKSLQRALSQNLPIGDPRHRGTLG
ncbi:hypothetical protein F183_A06980 [Bryobacterales bacterium F-183]|nr:hypothetical protein F183_A06980 [Bryobacterales bacterium F-183]